VRRRNIQAKIAWPKSEHGSGLMVASGYSSEYEMERLVRKALPMTIYAGTSEIQRDIIARMYGL